MGTFSAPTQLPVRVRSDLLLEFHSAKTIRAIVGGVWAVCTVCTSRPVHTSTYGSYGHQYQILLQSIHILARS